MKHDFLISSPEPFEKKCTDNCLHVAPATKVLISDAAERHTIVSQNTQLDAEQIKQFENAQVYVINTAPVTLKIPLNGRKYFDGPVEYVFDGFFHVELQVSNADAFFSHYTAMAGCSIEHFSSHILAFISKTVMSDVYYRVKHHLKPACPLYSPDRHNHLSIELGKIGLRLIHSHLEITSMSDHPQTKPFRHAPKYTKNSSPYHNHTRPGRADSNNQHHFPTNRQKEPFRANATGSHSNPSSQSTLFGHASVYQSGRPGETVIHFGRSVRNAQQYGS